MRKSQHGFGRLRSDKGMTLVEILVAMTLLVLIIMVFTPLFMTYFRNVRTAGQITQKTYERASLMERLLANTDGSNDTGYETDVGTVPIVLKSDTYSVDFTSANYGSVKGTMVSETLENENAYVSFYTRSTNRKMVCFPSVLTDDFITKEVIVVPKGFKFEQSAKNKNETVNFNFKVYNTKSDGQLELVPTTYYDIRYEKDGDNSDIAVFTFYGANNVICFERSPLHIYYCSGSVKMDEVVVEITAPEIIMVGEQAEDGEYYYYATAGVDTTNNRMDIIAKKMTVDNNGNSVALSSAMNDVEWVAAGEGDNGAGGKNTYGYYVMGGDNGQIRRFWKNETTGNYYWGGDYVVLYKAYSDMDNNKSSSVETMSKSSTAQSSYTSTLKTYLTTQATYESFYKSNYDGSNLIGLMQFKGFLDDYKMYCANFGSVTAKTTAGIVPRFYYDGNKRHNEDSNWFANSRHYFDYNFIYEFSSKTPQATYVEMTGDNTAMPITITSVGAVSLTAPNKSAYKSDNPQVGVATDGHHGIMNGVEAYPQTSYTLYCGTIPAWLDIFGGYFRNPGSHPKGYMGSPGIGYYNGQYGVTGIFADQDTGTIKSAFRDYNASSLLNWSVTDTGTIGKGKDATITPGSLLSSYYQDGGVTSHKVVDITMGYLSQPFANSTAMLQTHYTENTGSYFSNGSFNHTFFTAAPREFSTFLDIVSYHDDLRDATFSVAVGYGLGILAADARGYVRIGQMYNIGMVYLRASGNGTGDNDTVANQLDAGKGWSLQLESNIFHHFYGINCNSEGNYFDLEGNTSGYIASIGAKQSAFGWNDNYHKAKWNISTDANNGSYLQNENSHMLAQTECTTVDVGANVFDCTEFMVGTANGTVLSWYYDYSIDNSKSNNTNKVTRAVKKEFESYTWSDIYGSKVKTYGGHYDYWSTLKNKGASVTSTSFISSLTRINDITYADDIWVAVGNQGDKHPHDTGSQSYSGNGTTGSYINVRYYVNDYPVWRAVKFSEAEHVNIISVVCCQGVWYIMGYIDTDYDGINDANEKCVLYWSVDPVNSWARCQTRTGLGTNDYAAYSDTNDSFALYFDPDDSERVSEVKLGGINKMSSQAG